MDANDALAIVFSRNTFYRQLHFLALGVVGLLLLVILILSLISIHLYRNPPNALFFATDNIGRLIPIIPNNVPNMTLDDVSAWTVQAVETANSFDFVNYRAQLQGSQRYFTSYGWTTFMRALIASNNLVAVTTRKLVAVAKVVDKPKLVTQGVLQGKYAWKFQMPLLVTYMFPPYDGNSQYSNALTVNVIVQRQPILQSDKGLGILQLIETVATSAAPQTISNVPTPTS